MRIHKTPVMMQYSIFGDDAKTAMDREAVFFCHEYGTHNCIVKTSFGIQGGRGYFDAMKREFRKILDDNTFMVWGWVPERHVVIYKRILKDQCHVDVLFRGHPYDDGLQRAWIAIRRIDNGKTLGPDVLWDAIQGGSTWKHG